MSELRDKSYLKILRSEFDAEEGSFLLSLRCNLDWDRDAFNRLTEVMLLCCKDNQERTSLEKWIAEGFWYVSFFVRDWATHPNFPKRFPAEYYEVAFERLYNLASFLFMEDYPSLPETYFKPMSQYILGEGFAVQTELAFTPDEKSEQIVP